MHVLINEQEIAARVHELGAEIAKDYAAAGDLVFVAVLRGSLCFMADLMRATELPLRLDVLDIRSYQGDTGDEPVISHGPMDSVTGADVIVVEDILERGTTLARAVDHLRAAGARSVEVCTLLRKPGMAAANAPQPRYVGFDIGPGFVVGYGLDYDQHFRNLPFIAIPGEADLAALAADRT